MRNPASANRVRLFFIIFALTVCALGSYWWTEVLRRDREESTSTAPRSEPDYSIEKFSMVRMSKSGDARYSIAGSKLVHFPNNDSYDIQKPVLYNFNRDQSPVTMRAEQAIVEHASNKVHLYHNVQIERNATPESSHFYLASEYLLVLLDDNIMKTDKRVDIVFGDSHLSGTGLIANNATREFKLLHQVHGSAVPMAK